MDFDDNDDIGNFGLPPLNTTRVSRPPKRRGGKTSKPKKCAQKKNDMNQPHRRSNNTKTSSGIGCTMDIDSDSSSDDDEIALSDLAKMAPPPRKIVADTGNHPSSRRAVVTPASFFTNKQSQPPQQHQSRSKHGRNEGRNNNDDRATGEGQHRKKFKRQVGLDSFLMDKRQSKITTQVANSKAKVNASESLSSQHEQDRSRGVSFVSASSLLSANDRNTKEAVGQDSSTMLQDERNRQEVVSDSKAATSSNDSTLDEIDDFDDDVEEPATDNTSSTKEENSNNNHPQRFGIYSLIFGHGHPIMHPEEYYRAASTTTAIPTASTSAYTGVERQPQQNSHINRNILSHLLQRTYCSKSSPSSSNLLTRYIHSNPNQLSTESVQLSSSSSKNNSNNSETCAMAFDTMGILLAVGDNRGKIDIFDFDEVYSADLNKRNE